MESSMNWETYKDMSLMDFMSHTKYPIDYAPQPYQWIFVDFVC